MKKPPTAEKDYMDDFGAVTNNVKYIGTLCRMCHIGLTLKYYLYLKKIKDKGVNSHTNKTHVLLQ